MRLMAAIAMSLLGVGLILHLFGHTTWAIVAIILFVVFISEAPGGLLDPNA